MSFLRQGARDLLAAYDHSLEQQIVGRGSNLACRDEQLWKQVEGLLRDGDAHETHCLGLDPLRVMEESLKAAAAAAASIPAASVPAAAAAAERVRSRRGLQGLAKAFEVLEQAALNLYLSPWREEYKVVKMYSGVFTHYIKPVMSMQQIKKLFGLLGYQPSTSRHEQLRLQAPRVSPASLDDLLHLSCAFFLARCECRLLLTVLGKHGGDVQWELSVVKERQTGNSLQVALDNTKKMLEVSQPLMEPLDGELEVDLYTDEQIKGGHKGGAANDDESPRSLTWVTQNSASPSPVAAHSNGVTSLSSSSASLSAREQVCISTLTCQLTKMSPLESDTARSLSASMRHGRRPCEQSAFDKVDLQSHSLQGEAVGIRRSDAEANDLCSCHQSRHLCLKFCIECNDMHNITCAFLEHCRLGSHHLVSPDDMTEDMEESRAVPPQAGSCNSSVAMSSVLCDDPESVIPSLHPISYHDCCDLAQLDPQVLCLSCSVFHSGSCRRMDYCQNLHTTKQLGVCSCGRSCSRDPLVLCRYCGNEYCRDCWYRNPVVCTCGQTFDQSSSV